MRKFSLAAAIAAVTALAGCESFSLSTASSMRVEVEVYKGPLSESTPGQQGELAAVVDEAARVMDNWLQAVREARAESLQLDGNPLCAATRYDKIGCGYLTDAESSAGDVLRNLCRIRGDYILQAKIIPNSSYPPTRDRRSDPPVPPDVKSSNLCSNLGIATDSEKNAYIKSINNNKDETFLIPFSQDNPANSQGQPPIKSNKTQTISDLDVSLLAYTAGSMKSKAFRIGYDYLSYVPVNPGIRTLLTHFAVISSEYGNQLQSRLTVLAKQMPLEGKNKGVSANLLPLSDYLRDSRQTTFVQLYDWYDSTIGDGPSSTAPKLNKQDRIRAAERLFADYYWAKINEVYASGQGEVSMAFIKNEIGNWDLKQFSNDPTDLLAAYAKATTAVLAGVSKLATGGGAGVAENIGNAQKLADLAGQLASGRSSSATVGGLDAAALHQRTVDKLDTAKAEFAAKKTKLETDRKAALDTGKVPEADRKGPAAKIESCKAQPVPALPAVPAVPCDPEGLKALAKAVEFDKQIAELVPAAIARAKAILGDHEAVIEALQEAITPAEAPVAPPTIPSTTNTNAGTVAAASDLLPAQPPGGIDPSVVGTLFP